MGCSLVAWTFEFIFVFVFEDVEEGGGGGSCRGGKYVTGGA
jgi:hypothetical protein|tara:strand:+ start:444 stop:566 length:123 start_codon:yes stop_codon:yes gene_type:complete